MENFAGLTAPYSDYDKAKIVVLPVPYDATSTWVRGSEKGPEALLYASVALEWYDHETQTEVYRQGIHTLPPIVEERTPELLVEAVEQNVGKIWDDGKFPLTIGGNHTVSIGAFRALSKRFNNITVLQLDAHSDLRPTYEGSELNHACAMYQAQLLAPITQVGIRSSDVVELPFFNRERMFLAHQIVGQEGWQQCAVNTLSENVYITIDLDVFDPSIMSSTGTPEPGGMLYYPVLHFLREVIRQRNVVGIDIVELCPNDSNKAPDFMTARLAYQLLTYKFLKERDIETSKGSLF